MGNKIFKITVAKSIMRLLGRAIKGVYKNDENMRDYIATIPLGYDIKIKIAGTDIALAFAIEEGGVKIYGKKNIPFNCNLEIEFKNIEYAFPLLIGKKSITSAYCEGDFILKGSIGNAMVLVTVLNLVESYLFPEVLNRKLKITQERKSNKFKVYRYILLGV